MDNTILNLQRETSEEAEQAQLSAQIFADRAVEAIRSTLKTGPSLSHCSECGEDIPVERQRAVAGCELCIYCQSAAERLRRR